MKRAKRYTVKAVEFNTVEINHHSGFHGGETWVFWAPQDGGYVRHVTRGKPGTSGSQVMDSELNNGSTLYWNGKVPLVKLVRRQMRAYYSRIES